MFAAFARGNIEAIRVLLSGSGVQDLDDIANDPGFGKPVQSHFEPDLLSWIVEGENWALARHLMTSSSVMELGMACCHLHGSWHALWGFHRGKAGARLLAAARSQCELVGKHPDLHPCYYLNQAKR